ncbi:MAG TPA: hypothetical protein VLK88_14555 [Gemmatimonadales bacterium]|nr:hypothetical protein [Gemmatimonadales bacterium]
MSLLDHWMPVYEVSASYDITVRASPEAVYRALWETDFHKDPLIRALLTLRSLPGLILHPRATWRRMQDRRHRAPEGLRRMLRGDGFVLLAESPCEELVLGVTGRFWTPSAKLVPSSAATFLEPLPPNLARGVWSFRLDPVGASTRLTTETRVRCDDEASRRAFKRYWFIIGGASGLIRKVMLRQIKRAAEAGTVK